MKIWQNPPRRTAQLKATLEPHLDAPFATSELVLLCSFGPDAPEERSGRQLRDALLAAGFPGSSTGHLIRTSPLVRRSSDHGYRLREFQP